MQGLGTVVESPRCWGGVLWLSLLCAGVGVLWLSPICKGGGTVVES